MGKKIGQVNIDPESDTGFVQKEHWEKNFVCAQDFLRLIGTRLNLIATATATAKSLQSCLTLRPRRRQLTRLPRPWDSPGKNTGLGLPFLLQCMKVKNEGSRLVISIT